MTTWLPIAVPWHEIEKLKDYIIIKDIMERYYIYCRIEPAVLGNWPSPEEIIPIKRTDQPIIMAEDL